MNAYILPGLEKREIRTHDICRMVEDYFGIERGLLMAKTRLRDIVIPRQIAMYLIRQHTPFTLSTIGHMFGKEHSTVVYACRMVRDIIAIKDPGYYKAIKELELSINNHISNRHDREEFDYPVEHSTGIF
jgi:chromosomal replication initiator protein